MNKLLLIMLPILLSVAAYSGPPEPPDAPDAPEALEEMKLLEELTTLNEEVIERQMENLELKFEKLDEKYEGLGLVLKGLGDGLEITEILIGGDTIIISLSNDSVFIFPGIDEGPVRTAGDDIIHLGGRLVIEKDETVNGDVVSAFGDVIVEGTVEGGVLTFSGDIYVTSTGFIREGAVAFSGKVKREPGSRIGAVTWGTKYPAGRISIGFWTPYRVMGLIFLIIFAVWMVLSATCASLLKTNVSRVVESIRTGYIKSFFKGYLAYVLAFIAFIGLNITILGIPLALLGMPLVVLAAMVLASTAICNIIGTNILHAEKNTLKASFYGNMILGVIPGLLFLVQLITGSIAIMVLSWILIALFIFILIPIGLGAVLSTRFGTRPEKNEPASDKANQEA